MAGFTPMALSTTDLSVNSPVVAIQNTISPSTTGSQVILCSQPIKFDLMRGVKSLNNNNLKKKKKKKRVYNDNIMSTVTK